MGGCCELQEQQLQAQQLMPGAQMAPQLSDIALQQQLASQYGLGGFAGKALVSNTLLLFGRVTPLRSRKIMSLHPTHHTSSFQPSQRDCTAERQLPNRLWKLQPASHLWATFLG